MAKRIKRNAPYSITLLKGNLIIPAAMHAMEKGSGNTAPTKQKRNLKHHKMVIFR